MKVFISYSVHDSELVRKIAESIKQHVDEICYWDASKELGEDAWTSIFGWIDDSDLVLAVITDNTISRAMAVGNEIGHARARNKKIIPLVAPEVPRDQLGCFQGVTYERINRENPLPAIEAICSQINRLKQVRKDEAYGIGSFLVIAGLVALVIWGSSE